MQSFKSFLSLVLFVSCTVRCANYHQRVEKDDDPIFGNYCFLKELNNKGDEDISNFKRLIICVGYCFTNPDKNLDGYESIQKNVSFKTFAAEFSIQGQKNAKSFFELGNSGDYVLFCDKVKEIWYQKQMNLKILNHPSITRDSYKQVEKKTIIEIDSSKKIELSLIKGMDNLKLIIPIQDKPLASLISSDPPKVPEMKWKDESIEIFKNRDFEKFFFGLFLAEEDYIIKDFWKKLGMSAENRIKINNESSVVNILSKYFGEEAKGINSVEKESDGEENKKDGKGDSENEKQPKDKKEKWGIGKKIVLSVIVIGIIVFLLILRFLLYPQAKL